MPLFTHARTTWQDPKLPVTGPPIDWSRIDTVVIHYTAADDLIDGDPGESADNLPAYLRAIQRDYMTHRNPPYSVGYNAAVDWLGGSWELRGYDIKCAANKGHNEHTFAILMLVDGNDMATTYAAAEVRRLIAQAEVLARRELKITGHGQLTNPNAATACPGTGLRGQVAIGEFSPRWFPPLPPAPPTHTEDDDMALHLYYTGPEDPTSSRPELLCLQGKLIGFASPADRDNLVAATRASTLPIANPAQYDEVVRAFRA